MQNRSWNLFIVSISILIVCVIGYQLLKYYSMKPPALPTFGSVPAFSLLSQDRRPTTNNDFRGSVVIADFIFTDCAGPCPLMSAGMSEFQTSLADEPKIRLLSFSVDPETDIPEVLKEYGQRFHANNDRWTFLTGDKVSIYNLTRSGFHLTVEPDSNAVTHSTKYVLIDKKSMIRGYYDSGDKASTDRLLVDARALVKE
jgi:cytochrome oxidase Cu insertion factor (SCO1/SenC/PrrC family)